MGSNCVFCVGGCSPGVPGVPGSPGVDGGGLSMGRKVFLFAALVNKGGQTLGGAVALLK